MRYLARNWNFELKLRENFQTKIVNSKKRVEKERQIQMGR